MNIVLVCVAVFMIFLWEKAYFQVVRSAVDAPNGARHATSDQVLSSPTALRQTTATSGGQESQHGVRAITLRVASRKLVSSADSWEAQRFGGLKTTHRLDYTKPLKTGPFSANLLSTSVRPCALQYDFCMSRGNVAVLGLHRGGQDNG